MKYTLLELTQNILSSMDSDEVNNINDTVESQQVVEIIKTVYDDIISRGEVKVHKTLFNLTASTDNTKPVLMTKPLTIDSIDWIKYNRIQDGDDDPSWVELRFMPLDQFMSMTQALLPSETDVASFEHTVDGFTFTFNYRTDIGPTYYSSFDDNTLIFDSYDSDVDATLQTSKTLCFGTKSLEFVQSNSFTPALQPSQFALLLNEAKSLAWTELKQTAHPKAEQTARRNWIHLAKTRGHIPTSKFDNMVHPIHALPDFGRR